MSIRHTAVVRAMSLALFATAVAAAFGQTPQSPAFTYQGELRDGGDVVSGDYTMRFRLWDAPTGGAQVGSTITLAAVTVDDGRFSASLDFGADAFDGSMRWLEVAMRQPPAPYTVLSPRQPVTAAPVAGFSLGPWVPTSLGVHLPDGRVGVGTDAPLMDLEVRRPYGPGASPRLGISGFGPAGERWLTMSNAGSATLAWTSGTSLRFGTDVSPGGAFTQHAIIDGAGRLGVGVSLPEAPLHADGGSDVSLAGGGDAIFGDVGASNLALDSNEIMARFNGGATSLFLNPQGGNVLVASGGNGNLGVGTVTPKQTLHVDGDYYGRGHLWLHAFEGDGQTGAAYVQARDDSDTSSIRLVLRTKSGPTISDALTLIGRRTFVGEVESTVAPATMYVGHLDGLLTGPAMRLNRIADDGPLIEFQTAGSTRGGITVSGSTVSYNAFTGSHYAWSDDALTEGALVRMTGRNERLASETDSEIIYGVEPVRDANDAACLGVFIGAHSEATRRGRTIQLVAAEGNVDLWIADRGAGDIEPGDLLIASDIRGCAMRDDPQRFTTGHVVARAAEAVRWSSVTPGADGVRRARISVLLTSFTRAPDASSLRRENDDLRERIERLESLLQR